MDIWHKLNIKILTTPTSDMDRINNELLKNNIFHYEIITNKPAAKLKNTNNNISLFDAFFTIQKCDDTCKNITENHINLIEEYYEKEYDFITIFEDDFMFYDPILNKNIKNIYDYVTTNNNWDIMHLGCVNYPIPLSIPVKEGIVKCINTLFSHAYIISRKGMRKALDYYNKNDKNKSQHIDKLLNNACNQKYASFPSMVYQNKPPAIFDDVMNKLGIYKLINNKYNSMFYLYDYINVIIYIIFLIIIIIIIISLVYIIYN